MEEEKKGERSLVAHIAEDIRNKIIEQVFAPNEKLIEVELCRQYQVSRTPVREAFRLLENEGLLIHTPNSGVRIAAVSMEDSLKAMEIYGELNCIAVRYAAVRILPEEIARLREVNEKLHQTTDSKERNRLDALFHNMIVEDSGNKPLAEYLKLSDKNMTLIQAILPIQDTRLPYTYQEHSNLLDALEAHDQELAVEYAKIHFLKSQRSLYRKIQDYLSKQRTKKHRQRQS